MESTPSGARRDTARQQSTPADVQTFLGRVQRCRADARDPLQHYFIVHERCMLLHEEQARLLRKYRSYQALVLLIKESWF